MKYFIFKKLKIGLYFSFFFSIPKVQPFSPDEYNNIFLPFCDCKEIQKPGNVVKDLDKDRQNTLKTLLDAKLATDFDEKDAVRQTKIITIGQELKIIKPTNMLMKTKDLKKDVSYYSELKLGIDNLIEEEKKKATAPAPSATPAKGKVKVPGALAGMTFGAPPKKP